MNSCVRLIAALLVAYFSVTLAACTKVSDPDAMVARAVTLREKGDDAAAMIVLKNALQHNPDHGEARYLLGKTFIDIGEPAFAAVELQKALDLEFDAKRVLPELTKALILQEKFMEALDVSDPDKVAGARGSVDVLSLRAIAQLGLRQLAAAKDSLELALVLRPNHADALLTKARIALIEDNTDLAVSLADKALEAAPSHVDAWLLKGNLQRRAGDIDQARRTFQRAIETDRRSAAARVELASLELASKHYDSAARELEAVRAIAPRNVAALYLRALLASQRGDYTDANRLVASALEIAPRHVPSTILAGVVELALGRHKEAEELFHRALALDPRNLYGRRMLATSQAQRHDYAQALATLEPALSSAAGANDPALLAVAGEIYMQDRQYAKATEYFEKAVGLDPGGPVPRIGLGLSRVGAGQTEQAIADLEVAASLGPEGGRAQIMLAMIHLRLREFDQALRVVEQLELAQPDNMLVHNLKAVAFLGRGHIARARAQFERALQIDPAYFPAAANLAQLDVQAGNLKAARKRFEAVLERDGQHAQAMLALSELARNNPDSGDDEALIWIQRAKAVARGTSAPLRAEVDHFRRLRQFERAYASALELRAHYPKDPEALNTIGRLLLAMGRTGDAAGVFGERAELLAASPSAQLDHAKALLSAKDAAGAARVLHRGLRLSPGDPELQSALVTAELAQDGAYRALRAAKEVQTQLPRAPLGYMLEGDVLLASKKYPQAVVMYERAYALGKSAVLAMKLHDALVRAGRPAEGEQRLSAWLAQNPDDITTRRHLAYSAVTRENYKLALEQYRLVLQLQPDDPVVLNNIAWALYKTKQASALHYAKRAHALAPSDALIADTLGLILIERGEVGEGLAVLRRAAATLPSNRQIRFHLAQALAKAGETAAAISELQAIIGAGSGFPQLQDAIALLQQLRQ